MKAMWIGLVLALVIPPMIFCTAPAAHSQQETTVRCRLETTELAVGNETTLTIDIQDVSNLYAYQLELSYDPALLQVQDSDEGRSGVNVAMGDFLTPDFVLLNEADNEGGEIALAMNQMSPNPPQSGSGELAQATVRGMDIGSVNFAFEDVILSDADGSTISHQLQNCTLDVVEAPGPGPGPGEPTPTVPPTATPEGNPVPTTTSLIPDAVAHGGGAFLLTVNGTNFVDGSVVQWNGANRTTTWVSSTELVALILASDITTARTVSVHIFNPSPGGGTSNAQTLSVVECCDFNGHHTPGIDDVQYIANLWHDAEQYNIRYDVAPNAPDGEINVRDIMEVTTQLGTACSY